MKKLRISSLILAILMIVSMIPMMALSVLAEGEAEETPFPEMPATLPGYDVRSWEYFAPNDGTVPNGSALPFSQFNATYTTQLLIDFTTMAQDQFGGADTLWTPEGVKSNKDKNVITLTDGFDEQYAYNWRGASGILVAVDTSATDENDVDNAGSGWHMDFTAEVERETLTGKEVKNVVFSSSVNYRTDWQSYYYTYSPEYNEFYCGAGLGTLEGNDGMDFFEADTWACEILPNNNARIIDDFRGYVYLPFDCSFFCTGAGGEGTYESKDEFANSGEKGCGDIMTFNQAAEVYDDIKLTNLSISTSWSNNSAKFRAIYFVFADPVYNLSEDTEVEEIEGEAALTAPQTAAKVDANFDFDMIDGIRFNVDTTGVNAPVQLRLNLITDIKKNESEWAENVILGGHDGTKNTYINLTSDDYIETISRGYDCLMFYYDAEGNPVPLTATATTDIYAALPQGYKGEVYIPTASFSLSLTENLQIPVSSADYVKFTGLSFEYESTASGNVAISGIELCKTAAAIKGASLTLGTNLTLNVYALAAECYGNFSMSFYKNGEKLGNDVAGVKVEGETDMYRFSVTGIGLDEMTATFTSVLKLNGAMTSVGLEEYSVAKYVGHMVASDATTAAEKTALVDLLYYGDALLQFANADSEEEITLPTSFLTEDQKALRSADTTASAVAVEKLEGEYDELYVWTKATVDFSTSQFCLDIKAFLDDEIGITATITKGETTTEITSENWGVTEDHFWLIRYYDIGLNELTEELTCKFMYGDEQCGQTMTTTAATILARLANSATASAETKECARSLYSLGLSVAALAAAEA